jgi:hypothetical protein
LALFFAPHSFLAVCRAARAGDPFAQTIRRPRAVRAAKKLQKAKPAQVLLAPAFIFKKFSVPHTAQNDQFDPFSARFERLISRTFV